MIKQQTNLFIKILIVIFVLWFIKEITSSDTTKCKIIKSTFVVPQIERELMQKNMIYLYVRNPFLNEVGKDLILDTLRNPDDPTDRTNFSDIMTTYYNLQNQYNVLLNDISIVIKQLKNIYGISDITYHESLNGVVDFSGNIAYTQIINELSSTLTDNTKLTFTSNYYDTFTSTYDANIVANVSLVGSSSKTIKPAVSVSTPTIDTIKVLYDPNVKPNMLILNKGGLLTSSDKSYYRIVSVTKNPSDRNIITNDTMTLEIENTTSNLVTFNTLVNYQIIKRIGTPITTLTNFLYDQTIREDEIVIVFNNKMISFTSDSFDPNIYTIQYSKKKPLDFEIPPYQNFRRQQIMQLLYKNHF